SGRRAGCNQMWVYWQRPVQHAIERVRVNETNLADALPLLRCQEHVNPKCVFFLTDYICDGQHHQLGWTKAAARECRRLLSVARGNGWGYGFQPVMCAAQALATERNLVKVADAYLWEIRLRDVNDFADLGIQVAAAECNGAMLPVLIAHKAIGPRLQKLSGSIGGPAGIHKKVQDVSTDIFAH